MLICVTPYKGAFEPLVDLAEDGETIYMPHWKSHDVLNAQKEIEERSYTMFNAKLAYVSKATYRRLEEMLQALVNKCRNIQEMFAALDPVEGHFRLEGVSTAEFMAENADKLQHAGGSWLLPDEKENGACCIITPETARLLFEAYDAEHEECEEEEEDDWYDDPADDEWDEDDYDDECPPSYDALDIPFL